MNEMQSGGIRPDLGSGYSDSCWLGEMMPARENRGAAHSSEWL